MVSTGLLGPHPRDTIDQYVPFGETIGVYVWGWLSSNNKFIVAYVGRSDDHREGLNGRLHDYEGAHDEWTHFKYRIFSTAKDAFNRECVIWHAFPLEQPNHPDRPNGEDYPCPIGGTDCFK